MSIHGEDGMRRGDCTIPQGKRPHHAHYLLVQTATAGAEQKSVWTDEYGRTAAARQAYQLEKDTFPQSGDFASMKFTQAYDEQDGLRNECARKITALKAEAKLLECECKSFKSIRPEAFYDAPQSNLILTFQHDIRKSISDNPLYAETGKVGQAKLLVKAAERVLLDAQNYLAETETADRVLLQEQKTATWKTEQKTRKAYETKIAEVLTRYKEYNDFITDDGDQQLNVYFWNGFAADIKHKEDLAEIERQQKADRDAEAEGIGHNPRKLKRCPAIPNPNHQYDDEPEEKKQKVLPSLSEVAAKIHAFMGKDSAKASFDKLQNMFASSSTKSEQCPLSVVDSRVRGIVDRGILSADETEVINTLVKDCMNDGEVNYIVFTDRMGQSLDPEAYEVSWATQDFS